MNLESLRKKRARRLGVKASGHAGQRRIFFVLDRATRKFHGDIGLWMQYIDYARKQKSHKKVSQILTNVLRLHPTRPELWIYAASYAFENQGHMKEARSYMQIGLRFCNSSKKLWLEYAKLEMLYISKVTARRRILGLDESRQDSVLVADDNDNAADELTLPTITAEEINPNLRRDVSDEHIALQTISANPALSGAIPIAIFDASIELFKDDTFGQSFFDMAANFRDLPCLGKITQHIADSLIKKHPRSSTILCCYIRQPMIGIEATSAGFPEALEITLDRLKPSIETVPATSGSRTCPYPRLSLVSNIIDLLLPYLYTKHLDPDIHIVLSTVVKRMFERYRTLVQGSSGQGPDEVAEMIEKHQNGTNASLMSPLYNWALRSWPSNARLLALRDIMQPVDYLAN